VLRLKECAPTPSPFIVFTFGLIVESIKELGSASKRMIIVVTYSQFNSNIRVFYVFLGFKKNTLKYFIRRPIFKPLYFYNVFLKILENTSFWAPSKNTHISYVTTMGMMLERVAISLKQYLAQRTKPFVLQNIVFYRLDKTIGFIMFCNHNKCQLYYINYIVELVEDIFPQTSFWGRFFMLIINGQPWTKIMNFIKLVTYANE